MFADRYFLMAEREGGKSLPLLTRPLILSDQDPTVFTSFNLHYLLKTQSLNIGLAESSFGFFHNIVRKTQMTFLANSLHWGVRDSDMDWRSTQFSP